jgi:hypothetical protein
MCSRLQSLNQRTSPAYSGGYYLFVCDRPLTFLLTIAGTLALVAVALALLGAAAHLINDAQVLDQDELGGPPHRQSTSTYSRCVSKQQQVSAGVQPLCLGWAMASRGRD